MAPSCHSHTRLSTNHTYSAKSTKGPSGHDSTPYGDGRASPQSFFPHHLAAMSSAIVRADDNVDALRRYTDGKLAEIHNQIKAINGSQAAGSANR